MTTQNEYTISGWQDAGTHRVGLPSGAEILFRFPSIPDLIRRERIPDTLRAAAMREVARDDGLPLFLKAALGLTTKGEEPQPPDQDEVREMYELGELLIAESVVEPELELEDVQADGVVPNEDKEFLFMLIARARAVDARGRRLGVMPLDVAATFRGEHGCAEGCEACVRAQGELSTSRALLV